MGGGRFNLSREEYFRVEREYYYRKGIPMDIFDTSKYIETDGQTDGQTGRRADGGPKLANTIQP